MESINLQNICEQAVSLVKNVGKFVVDCRKDFSKEIISEKGTNDFVTSVDKKSEMLLVSGLKEIFPSAGFITEEQTETKQSDVYNWIVDPIDGTINFIHGLHPFAISVALAEKDEPVIGIVYILSSNELFYTWKGSQTFYNELTTNVSNNSNLKSSLIGLAFPYRMIKENEKLHSVSNAVISETQGFRKTGSAASDLAFVASGRFDGFVSMKIKPWDIAAGILLVKNANGCCCDFENEENCLFSENIIASNKNISKDLQSLINKNYR